MCLWAFVPVPDGFPPKCLGVAFGGGGEGQSEYTSKTESDVESEHIRWNQIDLLNRLS